MTTIKTKKLLSTFKNKKIFKGFTNQQMKIITNLAYNIFIDNNGILTEKQILDYLKFSLKFLKINMTDYNLTFAESIHNLNCYFVEVNLDL